MDQDKIIRAYTRLISLKQNLPQEYDTHEKYINDYHTIVDLLSKEINISLDEFKIPSNEIKPIWTGGNYLTGENFYSDDSYCEKTLFLSKLEALLSYFQIKYLSQEESKIGFNPPEK